MYHGVSKELSNLGSVLSDSLKKLDEDVNQKILMLLDLVTGYMDMVERHEKGLVKEHKLATEKIGMIKCRDLRGALVTDIELRDMVEKNISNHEVVLTDLESRQVPTLLSLLYYLPYVRPLLWCVSTLKERWWSSLFPFSKTFSKILQDIKRFCRFSKI